MTQWMLAIYFGYTSFVVGPYDQEIACLEARKIAIERWAQEFGSNKIRSICIPIRKLK